MQQRMVLTPVAYAAALGCALALAGCAKKAPVEPAPAVIFAPPPVATPGPTYRLGTGDELHVRFTFQPELSEQVPVRPDGRISLATTGELEVVGLTPTELEKVIIERSSARLRNPEVTVIVTKVGEQRVYVGGEVVRPGFVTLRPDMTILQAVLQAGGFQRTAKLDSVLLMTPDDDGRYAAARVDMQQVVEDGVPERIRLHPNAVVYAPPSWIGEMNDVVDLYVRGLIPVLPRVGVGYSLSGQNQ